MKFEPEMLALLGKTISLMENLAFLWVVHSGLELGLLQALAEERRFEDLLAEHQDWDALLLEHWLQMALDLDLIKKTDGLYKITKMGQAVDLYRAAGLEALYKELAVHWGIVFREVPGLIRQEVRKAPLGVEMEEELISKASQASEPFVWPFLKAKCETEKWNRILDIGCGEGFYLVKLAEEFPGLQGVGLELNPAVCSRAELRTQAYGERLRIVCGDALQMGEELGKFDACLLNNIIYYFDSEQRRTLLGNIRKSLRPGGQVGILTALRQENSPLKAFRTHIPRDLMSFFLACHEGFSGLPREEEIFGVLENTGYQKISVYTMPFATSHYFFAMNSELNNAVL